MSLRARLLLTTAVIALVALVAADVATYAELRSSLYTQIDAALELSHRPVEASVGGGTGRPPPSGYGGQPSTCTFDGQVVNTQGLNPGTVIEIRTASNTTVYECPLPELGGSAGPLPALPARITGFAENAADAGEPTTYFTAAARRGGGSFRVRASILRGGPARGGQLIVAVPLSGTTGTLNTLRDLELVVTACALAVALALGWWLVRASLRPLRDVEATAAAIAAGRLTQRVPGDQARTEVGRVARALNVMLERIQSAFAQRDRTEAELRASEERMRQFVGDASHELRTPVAAVQAYAELFDRGAADRPEDLRRLLVGIQRESARMGHLVEDLLLLAHLDEGRALQVEPVDLVALAGDAVNAAAALGPQWPVVLRATRPVEVEADPMRLRQVLDNLLGNVRVHCPPGTSVTVTVTEQGPDAVLTVRDDGPGLTPADAGRIFERFFRADPSRSRHHGGAGLGLAIVAAIVRAHGGSVDVSPWPSGGTTFAVHIPGHRARPATGGDWPTDAPVPDGGRRAESGASGFTRDVAGVVLPDAGGSVTDVADDR